MSEALLQVDKAARRFGELRAVDGISLEVEQGTITGLIGPNGAGKSTLFGLIAGAMRPDAGEIRFHGRRIDGLSPSRIFRAGLARTFQIPRPFPQMTVLENLMLVPMGQSGERFWNNWIGFSSVKARGASRPRPGDGGAWLHGARGKMQCARGSTLRRPAEAPRARPRADDRADLDPARRACGRRQSGPAGDADGEARRAQRARHDFPDHRAQHGHGDASVPPDHRHGAGQGHLQRRVRRDVRADARVLDAYLGDVAA